MSVDSFRKVLLLSGLLSQDVLSSLLDGLPAAERPTDARGLARLLVGMGHLTEFQAKAVLQGKTTGLVYGDYVVLDRIGAGGMGVVLKARHRRMDRLVALKVLPAKTMKSPGAIERFYREVKAAARLSHPNIVTAHDAGESDGTHYFVMEYVEGQDLALLVKHRGPLPIDQAIDYIAQAAQGLQYAHEQGIVHRDIKPANLLLDASGTVKILDMGLARFEQGLDEEDRDRLTQSGQVMGTCDYMAPEQAEDTHRADRRADVYSLGCSLYRLLTGRAMYTGDSLVTILLAHRDQPIPSLALARSDVPAQLDAVYQRMVAKKAEDRYQSMAEVVSTLESCRQVVPVGVSGDASAPAERSDSKLNAFLKGFSPAKETLQRQVDMETGQIEPPPAKVPRKSQPGWLYGTMGAAVVLAVTLGIAFLIGGGDEQDPSQVAKAPPQTASSKPSEPDFAEQESERVPELTATRAPEASPSSEKSDPEPGASAVEPQESNMPAEPPAETVISHQPEAQARTENAKPSPPEPTPPPTPQEDLAAIARQQLLEAQRATDAKYAAAMRPVEAKVVMWDFAAAWQTSEKIQFEEPELKTRLDNRRDEIRRMGLLKRRIVAKIVEANPPLKKSDLKIRGIGGEITDAGLAGLTTKTIKGEVERLTWSDLGTQAAGKLMELVVDPQNGEDCVAAGLLAFASGDRTAAERFFEQAMAAGVDVSAQLAAIAAATLAQANDLLASSEFERAASLLLNLQSKYSDLHWFESNGETFNAALATATRGGREAAAEALYTEAVKLFEQKSLFDLRNVVTKLNSEYADCRAATEPSREPSLADLTELVKDLGQRLVVRLDGKGNFVSIQDAIDASQPNSLIEIQDNGPYVEELNFAPIHAGITLSGAKGTWPIITSYGSNPRFPKVIAVENTEVTLQRLVLVDTVGVDCCMGATNSHVQMQSVLIYSAGGAAAFREEVSASRSKLLDCVFLNSVYVHGKTDCQNCLFVSNARTAIEGPSQIRACTFLRELTLSFGPTTLHGCIVGDLINRKAERGHSLENCGIYGEIDNTIEVNPSCVHGVPLFRDPANLDCRLMPDSPCIGKASDGGDIGCQYTPEMMEMCRIALELRAKGIIKF